MEKIGRLLERGLLGGVVLAAACVGFAGVLWLLYRLIRRARPKEVRQEEKRISSHRLYQVSGRGRVAYLVLCLEETLRFYGQDPADWAWILRRMWSITDGSEEGWMDIWLDAVGELLPSEVLTDNTAGTASAEAGRARDLYTRAGTAMIVITEIMEDAYTIVGQWSPGMDVHDPDAICRIEKAEETMRAYGVPRPSDEAIQPLLARRDLPLGKPFDGSRLSLFSKQGR